MAEYTLNILKPSVNNLTVRIFMRAAGLDFEEVDVWGKSTGPEYVAKYPPHLTPSLEFLRSIDYAFPEWTEEYLQRVEDALGDAYSEPAADVRGYVASVKAPA